VGCVIKVRTIKSPVTLAACGAFLVPEPLGVCLMLAAGIWWLCRKIGASCRSPLSLWEQAPRRYFAAMNAPFRGDNLDMLQELHEAFGHRLGLLDWSTHLQYISCARRLKMLSKFNGV
jgi:hypothetical protein